MSRYAALVQALYEYHGRWQLVANAVNGEELHHSAGYYQGIAGGQTKRPNTKALTAIWREVENLPASITAPLKCPTRRVPIGVLTVSRSTWLRLRGAKSARGDVTWDALLDEAAGLLEEVGR